MAESGDSTIEYPVPVALNSDVALECDVLDTKPPPQIKWYDDQGEIQEVKLPENRVRFLDSGRYLYLRMLNSSHLERQYYCMVINVNMSQNVSAPTRYVLTDNLIQGVLMDYKQIGDLRAFVGNTSLEFAYVGGAFGSNSNNEMNGTFVNSYGPDTTVFGNVGTLESTSLSSSRVIQLEATVHYNGFTSSMMRNGSVTVYRKLHVSIV